MVLVNIGASNDPCGLARAPDPHPTRERLYSSVILYYTLFINIYIYACSSIIGAVMYISGD